MGTRSVHLAYGKDGFTLQFDDDRIEATIVLPKDPAPLANPQESFLEAVCAPLGSPALREVAHKALERVRAEHRQPKVVIAIADHTRPVPDRLLVPWLVDFLKISDAAVSMLIGTGSHRGSTEQEWKRMLGQASERFRILNHDCQDPALVFVGNSKCGGACWLNPEWVQADLRLATGFIEPHFYAGFSGGSKAVVPGIAGLETIRHFHRASLIENPSTTWGSHEGNPLQALTREMTAFCPPHFIVNVTLNRAKEITGFYAGGVGTAHDAGCREALNESIVRLPRRFPVVVTTNGGFPHDQNFYQTVKGISAASRIVEPNGTILAISQCEQGLPSEGAFERILAKPLETQELYNSIVASKVTEQDQWQVQTLLQCLAKARVILNSTLNAENRALTRTSHTSNPNRTLQQLAEAYPAAKMPVAILPLGPLTIPEVCESV